MNKLMAKIFLTFLSALIFSGCFFTGRNNQSASSGQSVGLYRLRPQDPIQITLLGIPEEKGLEVIVDEYGRITLPYIDEPLKVDGMTTSELERFIQKRYIDGKIYRSITVNVLTSAKSYFIEGEIRRPQEYMLNRGITLLQAIAAAGGYTEYANKRNILVTRRGGEILKFDARYLERNPNKDILIQAGDRINVNRTFY